MSRIAFIGLGNMGGGMAANQAKAGHAVAAFDLSAEALERAVGAPKQNIRVWIHDVPKENWGIAGESALDLGR